ncbi:PLASMODESMATA CALLOSE-BINDING PROTEIN 2-like [Salvia miltiorrhiza]|uniref:PLASMODESMATA CALLOSE-BINDING PROTEIN 2-like n=1 Tax=Salvia miltiorrhiza TaxID=226208 RepID=UPI0025AD1AD1|nr:PLASMODESMATA CALLOSE-BINDING PROTEIN 2-like [Salvia miltiorrhiza]
MAALVLGFVIYLALAAPSDAAYCLCNAGVSDAVLQKNIDYACGNGADCSAILQNGACFNPNTVKDHCNYAVNSYYQRRSQNGGSCDFQGSASVSQTGPTGVASACVYQASPSTGGGTTTPTSGGGATTIPGGSFGPTGSTGFGTTDNGASVTLSSLAMLVVSLFLSLVISRFI